jgi:hypothetical protein
MLGVVFVLDSVRAAIMNDPSYAGTYTKACYQEECIEIDRTLRIIDKDGMEKLPDIDPNSGMNLKELMQDSLRAGLGAFSRGGRGKVRVNVEHNGTKVEVEIEIEVNKK